MGIWRYYLQKWEKRLRCYGGHYFRRVLLRCQSDIQVRMLNRQPREEVTSEEGNMEEVCATAGSWQPMSHVGLRNIASWLLSSHY